MDSLLPFLCRFIPALSGLPVIQRESVESNIGVTPQIETSGPNRYGLRFFIT